MSLYDPEQRQLDPTQLVRAAWWGICGGRRALAPLLEALRDPSTLVRRCAVWGLERVGTDAVAPLVEAFADASGLVRSAAVAAVGRIGGKAATEALMRALGDDDVGQAAARALSRRHEGCLAEAVSEAMQGRPERLAALHDRRALAPLVQALQSRSPERREHAVRAVGVMGESEAMMLLIKALGDPEWRVREAATEALAGLGERAWPRLHHTLRSGTRAEVGAAQALARGGAPDARKWLTAQRRQGGRGAVAGAIGLAHLGDASTLPTLQDALVHRDAIVRCAAAQALGALAAQAAPALDALRHLAHDDNSGVRHACGRAAAAIEAALSHAPSELESASAPAGMGTELVASPPPAGRGDELETAQRPK